MSSQKSVAQVYVFIEKYPDGLNSNAYIVLIISIKFLFPTRST